MGRGLAGSSGHGGDEAQLDRACLGRVVFDFCGSEGKNGVRGKAGDLYRALIYVEKERLRGSRDFVWSSHRHGLVSR